MLLTATRTVSIGHNRTGRVLEKTEVILPGDVYVRNDNVVMGNYGDMYSFHTPTEADAKLVAADPYHQEGVFARPLSQSETKQTQDPGTKQALTVNELRRRLSECQPGWCVNYDVPVIAAPGKFDCNTTTEKIGLRTAWRWTDVSVAALLEALRQLPEKMGEYRVGVWDEIENRVSKTAITGVIEDNKADLVVLETRYSMDEG